MVTIEMGFRKILANEVDGSDAEKIVASSPNNEQIPLLLIFKLQSK
jgi:hypothetical protein|tara:strand:+ start:829 stop:966 length:138 start_codon:yes stop_codon:yes gene_type:complete